MSGKLILQPGHLKAASSVSGFERRSGNIVRAKENRERLRQRAARSRQLVLARARSCPVIPPLAPSWPGPCERQVARPPGFCAWLVGVRPLSGCRGGFGGAPSGAGGALGWVAVGKPCSWAHRYSSSNTGLSALADGVISYSTRGGTSG